MYFKFYEQDQQYVTLDNTDFGQANKSAEWMPWH